MTRLFPPLAPVFSTKTTGSFPILVLGLMWLLSFQARGAAPTGPRGVRGPDRPARAATAVLAPAASDPLGVAREIWMSPRTDNQPGEGTLSSPFNGSGEGFDAKMRELSVTNPVTNLSVHLLAGTFDTRGYPFWFPRAGWRIRGAGMRQTTIKLVVDSNAPAPLVISSFGYAEADNVEVSDLTMDCNHSPTNSNYASAIYLWGSGNAIRRVRAINANGYFPIENFTLAISIGPGPRSEGNVIEECEVSDFRGTYATAIHMGGGYEYYNTKTIQGVIRRNKVFDLYNPAAPSAFNAYGFGGADGGVVEDNLAFRCGNGFYIDTGRTRNLTIRKNLFLGCKYAGVAFPGRNLDQITIEDNFIEMDTDSGAVAGILCSDDNGNAKLTNFQIRNNIIRPASNRFSRTSGILLGVAEAESFVVTGNRIDAGFRNLILDGNRATFFDNTDFNGNPILALGVPIGNQVNLPKGETGTLLLNKGSAYVIAEVGANPAANGTNLIQAYARAKAMRPHGEALSASNRVTVFLFPGRYTLPDSALVLDAPFVDLVGLGNGRATRLESEGNTLMQLADDLAIENLTLHCAAGAASALGPQDKAAYFPSDNLCRTVVKNCVFSANNNGWSMRLGITYAGSYENCSGGPRSWGWLGGFAGQALNCQAGALSFGGGGLFSGAATNCTAGPGSFGGGGFHGVAKNCTAGDGSFGGSGWMIGCDVSGAIASAVPTTGKLTDCRIGPAPGDVPAIVVGAGARLLNCTLLANPVGSGFSIDAASPVTAAVSHCRLNHGMRNVVNTITQPFNVDDPHLE